MTGWENTRNAPFSVMLRSAVTKHLLLLTAQRPKHLGASAAPQGRRAEPFKKGSRAEPFEKGSRAEPFKKAVGSAGPACEKQAGTARGPEKPHSYYNAQTKP